MQNKQTSHLQTSYFKACEFWKSKIGCLSMYRITGLRRRIAKEKCKQIKKSGKINIWKMDTLDNFNKVMV